MCVAAKSDPYGYVLINGCEIGVTGVARLGSVTEAEAATLLDELERNGVFSRDRKGRIFSRRMVRESATRKKASVNGKKGGNPALTGSNGKTKGKDTSLNHTLKQGGSPLTLTPYPSSTDVEDSDDDDVDARARASAGLPTLRERLLAAIRIDPSGLTGPNGKLIGSQADMAEVARWLAMPGMTEDGIVAEVERIMRGKAAPPSTLKYFRQPMMDLSAALIAPPLLPSPSVLPRDGPQPSAPTSQDRRRDAAEERQRRIIEAAVQGTTGRGFG